MALIKATVFMKDRTPRSKFLRPKHITNKEGVKHFSMGDGEYHIDPNCSIYDRERIPWKLGKKTDVVRYYYIQGNPSPIPLPNLTGIESIGIPSEELQIIFTPRFYDIIAKAGKNNNEQLLLYGLIGVGLLGLYSAYQLGNITTELQEMKQRVASETVTAFFNLGGFFNVF